MSARHNDKMLKPPKPVAVRVDEVKEKQQKAEELEIAGRHKNSGQKDHVGAR